MVTYKRSTDYKLREIAGEFMLIAVGTKARVDTNLLMVNRTGAFIWNLLEEEKTGREILTACAEHYHCEIDDLSDDVRDFLASMIMTGLIMEIKE